MRPEIVVSGMGVISAIGQGKAEFVSALLQGKQAFGVMQRDGRQNDVPFLGAEIKEVVFPTGISAQTQRAASFSAKLALVVLQEAWDEARLTEVAPERIGLVVGGSNVQQRDLTLTHNNYAGRTAFLRPSYALSFLDTDICGFCTAQFGIRGLAFTVGGASASGQLAIIQAAQAVIAGEVDVCIALGALMDLSSWECHALRSLGAMGSDRYANDPARACRPFDRARDGFIFGEACGAVVVESIESCYRRKLQPHALLRGWGHAVDGNRNPDPSLEGEVRAIRTALRRSGRSSSEIDYINPHGTGSVIGDATELQALTECGLNAAYLNATKSLVGHGLTAAGTVEVIATLLQMKCGRLHASNNLEHPLDPAFNWVRASPVEHQIENALTLSMGFGGINTALSWERVRQ